MLHIYSGKDQYEYFMASEYTDITDVETSPRLVS